MNNVLRLLRKPKKHKSLCLSHRLLYLKNILNYINYIKLYFLKVLHSYFFELQKVTWDEFPQKKFQCSSNGSSSQSAWGFPLKGELHKFGGMWREKGGRWRMKNQSSMWPADPEITVRHKRGWPSGSWKYRTEIEGNVRPQI